MEFTTVLGLVAAICTTTAFVPQALKVIQTKNTKDLSLGMYLIFTTGVLLWFIYGYLIQDYPVMIANGITLIFSSTILFMKLKYK